MAKYTFGNTLTSPKGNTYEIIRYLGEGVTAQVYLAKRTVVADGDMRFPPGSQVALKVQQDGLPDDIAQNFRDEATIMGDLAYHLGEENAHLIPSIVERAIERNVEQQFIALEFVVGQPMTDLVKTSGPMTEMDALILAGQVLTVLQTLHKEVRRSYIDFQLQNIWWQAETKTVKVMDWNHVSRRALEAEIPPGVPDDLIRFGAFLYQITTGKGAQQTGETAYKLAQRAGERWETLSAALRAAIQRALHPNPQKRFITAAGFRMALQEIQQLWQQEVEDLDLDTLTAMRPIQSAAAKGIAVNEEQLTTATILVDMLRRRQPGTLKVDEYWQQLQELEEGVSATWYSGRQNYRLGTFSKAEEIWQEEATAVGRVDLWRWVQAARLANAVGMDQYQEEYQTVVEQAIRAVEQEQWDEASNLLSSRRNNHTAIQQLSNEVQTQIAFRQAMSSESRGEWYAAENQYQRMATLLTELTYRPYLEAATGWNDEFLNEKIAYCQLKASEIAAAEDILGSLDKDFDQGIRDLKTKLGEEPGNRAVHAIIEQTADRQVDGDKAAALLMTVLVYGAVAVDDEGRLRHKLQKAQYQYHENQAKALLAARDWQRVYAHLESLAPEIPEAVQGQLRQEFETAVQGGWLGPAEAIGRSITLFATAETLNEMSQQLAHLRERLSDNKSNLVETYLDKAESLIGNANSVDWRVAEALAQQVEQMLANQNLEDSRIRELQQRLDSLRQDIQSKLQQEEIDQCFQKVKNLIAPHSTIGKAAKELTHAENLIAQLPEGEARQRAMARLEELQASIDELKKKDLPADGLQNGSGSGSRDNRNTRLPGWAIAAAPTLLLLLSVLALGGFLWQTGNQQNMAVATRLAEVSSGLSQVETEIGQNSQNLAQTQNQIAGNVATLRQQIETNATAIAREQATLAATLFPSPTPITPTPIPTPTPAPQTLALVVSFAATVTPPGQENGFYDLPDMQLQAPDGWQFGVTESEVTIVDPAGASGSLHLIYQGNATPLTEPLSRGVIENGDGLITELDIRWGLQAQTEPLAAGEYTILWQSEVAGQLWQSDAHSFTVVSPQQIHVAVGASYRSQPEWDRSFNVITDGVTEQTAVEAIGKRIVSQEGITGIGTPRTDALFLLIRLPGTRQLYWLGDQHCEEYNQSGWQERINSLPDV